MALEIAGPIALEEIAQNEYAMALLIFAASLVISKILHIVLETYAKKVAAKTKSDLDDLILKATTNPTYVLIVLIGAFLAIKRLSFLGDYAVFIDNAFLVAAVINVAFIVSRVFDVLISHWLRVQQRYEKTPKLISKVVAIVVYLIAVLIVLAYFRVEITPVIAALGLGGLAVGLALQDTLSNFFAGIHILTDRPINVGDFIEVDGTAVAGFVEDINWRSTRIRTLANTQIILPNSKVAGSVITNDSNSNVGNGTGINVPCGVAYDSDLRKVERVTLDVARKVQDSVPGAMKGFEPFLRYQAFGDSNINFSVVLRVEKVTERYTVMHEFIKALKERYDREGIEISVPARKIFYGNKPRKRSS